MLITILNYFKSKADNLPEMVTLTYETSDLVDRWRVVLAPEGTFAAQAPGTLTAEEQTAVDEIEGLLGNAGPQRGRFSDLIQKLLDNPALLKVLIAILGL